MRINLTDPRLSPTASCLSKRGRRPKPTHSISDAPGARVLPMKASAPIRTKFRCAVRGYLQAGFDALSSAEPRLPLDHSQVLSTSWRVWRTSLYLWAMLNPAPAVCTQALDDGTLWGNSP